MPPRAKYNADYHDDWAWSLGIKGATDQEVAEAFGVSRRTILRWRAEYPSFNEAYQRGKDIADAKVKKALYLRAVGYEVEDKERTVDVDPKTGESKPVRVKTTTKSIPPDTMAIMYWLNNRSRGEFTQRQEITLGGSVRTSPMENLSEEELRKLARLDEEYGGEE